MKIRAGYDIAFQCYQETPMVLMLSVHPSRQPDLLTEHRIRLSNGIDRMTIWMLWQYLHPDRRSAGFDRDPERLYHRDSGQPDESSPMRGNSRSALGG